MCTSCMQTCHTCPSSRLSGNLLRTCIYFDLQNIVLHVCYFFLFSKEGLLVNNVLVTGFLIKNRQSRFLLISILYGFAVIIIIRKLIV